MRTVKVEFKKNGKQYIFFDNNIELNEEDNVIVETEKGLQFGTVVALGESVENEDHAFVYRVASKEDVKQHNKNIKEAKEALLKAEEIAKELNLDMKFIDSSFTFDKKQLIFQFLADNRIDFRELAKSLAAIYKTRIELRQVGARDKAKEVSGIGPCGRKLCCASFLNDLDSVGIAQVKNQNLALNPTKINGVCGRLLCCLNFEDSLYKEFRKNLPEIGDKTTVNGKDATVVSLDIPAQKYTVLTDEDNERIEINAKVEQKKEENKKEKNRDNKYERRYSNK